MKWFTGNPDDPEVAIEKDGDGFAVYATADPSLRAVGDTLEEAMDAFEALLLPPEDK
jgi:hypothetical protein